MAAIDDSPFLALAKRVMFGGASPDWRVRLICKGTMADAVWYDYHGGSEVADEWLCTEMTKFCGGRWIVRERYGYGNGHFGAALDRVTS